jgi:AcrR family transcriptional regulator
VPRAAAEEPESAENNHDRKRHDILQAAATVFWERGYSAGTTKEVAERVGLSQPSIYHYVGSKSVLLHKIVSEAYAALLRSIEEAARHREDPEAHLAAIVRGMTRAITENREFFGVLWQEFHRLPADLQAAVRKDERTFVRETQRVVGKLQASGRLPDNRSASVVASAILGMVSWTYQWYRPGRDQHPDAVADTYLELIGISSPRPSKSAK